MRTNINKKSDFDFIVLDNEGNAVDMPSNDFTLDLWTWGSKCRFRASSIGGVLKGCKNEGGKLRVYVDNPGFVPGKLVGEWMSYVSSEEYPDGTQRTCRYISDFGIDMVDGDSTTNEQQVLAMMQYIQGASAYEIACEHGYQGTEEEWLNSLSLESVNAANECRELMAQLSAAEDVRNANEQTRIANEQARVESEGSRSYEEDRRAGAERTRIHNESVRYDREKIREDAENYRITHENSRESNETMRQNSETARVTAEESRVAAEKSRQAAEQARETAEVSRATAEEERKRTHDRLKTAMREYADAESLREEAEAERREAEQYRTEYEQSRQSSEATRATAERSRVADESQRVTAETARSNAESSRATAETARQEAETARQEAEQARVAAETNRESAETDRADAEAAREEAESARAEEFAGFTATLAAKEDVANKVTSINADADDTHYPSAKAVKDAIGVPQKEVTELLHKTLEVEQTITNNVTNSWSQAFPVKILKGQTYHITTNSAIGNAVFAFTNNSGNHVASDEIQRFVYNANTTPIIEYVPTVDSNYMWVYAGGDFNIGDVISIKNVSSLESSVKANKEDADKKIDSVSERLDFVNLGVGAISHYSPLKGNCSFAVIGDSISTYNKVGYFYPTYEQYYPQESMGITDIKQQYWFNLYNRQGGRQLVNASYSGSCVTTINAYPDFYARTLVVGVPDICIVALGSNDSNGQVEFGDYDYSSPISSLSESQFIPAYIKGIKNLLAINPKMQIVCVAFKMNQAYKDAIKTIAEYFGQFYIDCSTYSTNDGLHPNADGMEQIYDKINAFLAGDNKSVKNDTLKSISTERIPWQFIHNTGKISQIHFCLGGDEYIMAQYNWVNEARMGGYAWWMTNGRVGKHIPFSIGTDRFKIVIPAWANASDDFEQNLIVAGQHMYQQYWRIGLINPETGVLASSYKLPFEQDKHFVGNIIDGYNHFEVNIEKGKTYRISRLSPDNQVIKVSTSINVADDYIVADTDGNPCKETLYSATGNDYTFTPSEDASYIHVYQGNGSGTTTSCEINLEIITSSTDANAVTAMSVYDMRDASDVRLLIASDVEKQIYNIKALDGSDARTYNYPTGVSNISAICLDEFGKLYVAANDTSLAPYDGNTIYVLDPMRNGAVLGHFVIPRKADGGMGIKEGILYTFDNRTATINKISLGGVALAYNGRVTPYHIPLSYMFNKRGVAVSGGAGEANVIYDEDMGLFRMWYSRGSIAYSESYNGINWTTPEDVIPNASRSHVFKHNGTWHIYYVRTDNTSEKFKEVYHRTSQDGITWGDATLVMTSSQVVAACANSVWSDFMQFGSVYVTIENDTWKMLIEGKTETDNTWSIGYAESVDGNTWVVDGNSPTTINHPSFTNGKGQKMIGRTKVFYRDSNGIYWMTCHYSQYLDIPTRIGLAWSTDLKHINVLPSSPLLDFTEIEECDQLADAWMMEHDGKLYLYNSCVRNYSPEHSYIRVTTLGMSAKDFVESVAIIKG